MAPGTTVIEAVDSSMTLASEEHTSIQLSSSPSTPMAVPNNVVKAQPVPIQEKPQLHPADYVSIEDAPSPKKRTKRPVAAGSSTTIIESVDVRVAGRKSKAGKAEKANVIGAPSSWPDYRRPTTEECRVVEQALSKHHRERARPEKQPDASHTVCGCGEVEHLIDGLLHVLLSKKTSGGNANKALIGLFEAYGSHYKTVPWNAVRLGSVETLKGAIRSGGLADKKSREIKQILNIAYNEDSRRRRLSSVPPVNYTEQTHADPENLADAVFTQTTSVPNGQSIKQEPRDEAASELMYTEDDMLQSLDYLRELDTSNIYNKLIQFEGVGQKSVACVLLLNCRRPVLATDTHVFDISMRLRWVPEEAIPNDMKTGIKKEKHQVVKKEQLAIETEEFVGTEDPVMTKKMAKKVVKKEPSGSGEKGRAPFLATRVKVFAHLDVRVPDKLKYSIHQLMVEHGRTCTRCNKSISINHDRWHEHYPLEGLLTRSESKLVKKLGKGTEKGLTKLEEYGFAKTVVKEEFVEDDMVVVENETRMGLVVGVVDEAHIEVKMEDAF